MAKKGIADIKIIVGIVLTVIGALGSAFMGLGVETSQKTLFWIGSILLAIAGLLGTAYSRWI